MTTLPDDHRAELLAAKLRALATRRWEPEGELVAGAFPSGATLVDRSAGRAWVLVEDGAAHRLGAAMAVAARG
ncbi:MAG: hypothetical protein KF703_10450, partial [Actinobacteria bacterium]|nr:hypothetical protein [Actinomycetota bacterium]